MWNLGSIFGLDKSEDDISDSEVDWNLVLGEESSDSEEEED